MEKIDKYLHLLYKGDNGSEVLELKEELREHLILSVNEFINQGYTEEEVYDKVYFRAEIEHNPLVRDRDFFRNVLVIGIISFCVDILLLLISIISKYKARVRTNRINMI